SSDRVQAVGGVVDDDVRARRAESQAGVDTGQRVDLDGAVGVGEDVARGDEGSRGGLFGQVGKVEGLIVVGQGIVGERQVLAGVGLDAGVTVGDVRVLDRQEVATPVGPDALAGTRGQRIAQIDVIDDGIIDIVQVDGPRADGAHAAGAVLDADLSTGD